MIFFEEKLYKCGKCKWEGKITTPEELNMTLYCSKCSDLLDKIYDNKKA